MKIGMKQKERKKRNKGESKEGEDGCKHAKKEVKRLLLL